ncbi:MAG: beta-lactamase family protein [Balneolaceae bacterium]|nr:beta-lactamase family protein [Balneolaceae bacterium]
MRRLLFILSFFVICTSLFAQDVETEQDILDAERIVKGYYDEYNIPGMSVSVYRDGEIIWSKGFGYMDVEKKIPVNPAKTLFRIGSVSKTYTAAGVGVLIQRDKLDLEEEVQTYVPHFPEKEYAITVEQVAGHIAGIRHYRGDEFMSSKRYETIDEGLEIFEDDTLLFEPGTNYSYSSYGWNLISAVIEGASGQDFLSFMEKEVFEAMNLNHTMPDYAYKEIPNRTRFYIYDDGENIEAPYVDNSYKWAGGGFLSTTEDMIRFGEAHLSAGFLNQETLDRLMAPLSTNDGESTNYGIGWRTMTGPDGSRWLGHSGGSVGGSTMFIIHPEKKVIIAFAINRSNAPLGDLVGKLPVVFID